MGNDLSEKKKKNVASCAFIKDDVEWSSVTGSVSPSRQPKRSFITHHSCISKPKIRKWSKVRLDKTAVMDLRWKQYKFNSLLLHSFQIMQIATWNVTFLNRPFKFLIKCCSTDSSINVRQAAWTNTCPTSLCNSKNLDPNVIQAEPWSEDRSREKSALNQWTRHGPATGIKVNPSFFSPHRFHIPPILWLKAF